MSYIKFELIYICAVSMLSNAALADEFRAPSDRTRHGTVVETGVIFSEKVTESNKLCSRPRGCWLPTPADVDILESDMARYLSASKKYGAVEIANNLTAYKRKYFGYKTGGERWISVVGICSTFWRPTARTFQTLKRPVTDMGTCFFEVEYNVERRKFMDLYIDGEA